MDQLAAHHELDEGVGDAVLFPGREVLAGLEGDEEFVVQTVLLCGGLAGGEIFSNI